MYIAPGQGLTTPLGRNFNVNRNILSLRSFVASLKKNLFEVWIYSIFFPYFIHVCTRSSGADSHRGHNFDVKRNLLSLFSFATSLKKFSFKSDFTQFISWFYTCAGPDNPLGTKFKCQQEHLVTSVIWCKFQNNLFKVWFYTFFFSWFIHVYNPRTGADSPPGTKFWCHQKCLVNSFICCKFQKMSLKSDFIHFLYGFIHVYSHGTGVDSPQGTKFWCQQKGLIILPICCKFQRSLFEVWFYTFFSWFHTCI